MIYIIVFILGAAVGSFVNVAALRHNTGLSFLKGSSMCLSCARLLSWRELIPIVSYIKLKGRCPTCHARFSIQYLLVEVFSGILVVLLYLKLRTFNLELLVLFLIFEFLLLIFLYDLRHKIIPDSFVLIFIGLSFIYSYFVLHTSLLDILVPAVLIPLPFFLIWLLSKGRLMGLGDAKLMAGMGILLGLSKGISAVFLSFWLGGIYVFILYLSNKVFNRSYNNINWKSELPFAPFLVLGTGIGFFFGINLLNINF